MNNYTVDYFIKKFEAISEKFFEIRDWGNGEKRCTNGHCGMHHSNVDEGTLEAKGLNILFKDVQLTPFNPCNFPYMSYWWYKTAAINDGRTKEYQQPTPKQRILAALYDIKKMEDEKFNKEVKELQEKKGNIRYVAVSESLRDIAKESVLETIINN